MINKIDSSRIELIACDEEILLTAIESNEKLAELLKINVTENWTEFGSQALIYSLNKIRENSDEYGWWTYLPILKNENTLIGTCGYKGKANEVGMVEIGYEVKYDYRNRGFATEIAEALVNNAFLYKEVKLVQAHTLGEINHSTKVLEKCGFKKVEEIHDPEDGIIWRWEINK